MKLISQIIRYLTVYLIAVFNLASAGLPSYDEYFLKADFNDMNPGSTIGVGGAAFGEPLMLSGLVAEIYETNPGENYLYVKDPKQTEEEKYIYWEFINNIEFTQGKVVISFEFIPEELDNYSFAVREQGGTEFDFLSINYEISGEIIVSDKSGTIPIALNSYQPTEKQSIQLTFDMDTNSSQMLLNGIKLFNNRNHGLTARGVGSLLTGYGSNPIGHPFTLDDLIVTAVVELPLVLDVDFENGVLGQSIGTGGPLLGEPVSVDIELYSEIIDYGIDNQALLVERIDDAFIARSMRWELLSEVEFNSGMVVIDVDIELREYEDCYIYIRENSTSASSFLSMKFKSSGEIVLENPGTAIAVGNYIIDQDYRVRMVFNMDDGTYSVFLNGEPLAEDRDQGVTTGRGVGAVLTSFGYLANPHSAFIIDNLQVGASEFDLIFKDDFESVAGN